MGIAKTAAKGVFWMTGSTLVRALLQFSQILLVVRILSRTELGLLAMVNIVIGFGQIFGDMGISNAIIYHKDLKPRQLNQLYLVNIGLGVLLTTLVILTANILAGFFEMPDLVALVCLVAPVFIIHSFSNQPMAVLQQKLKFAELAKAETFSTIALFSSIVVLFLVGWRTEAVVVGQLISEIVICVLVIKYSEIRLPRLAKIHWKDIAAPVKYGIYQAGEACINTLSAQFDKMLIAKMLGPDTLGVYSYIKAFVFRPALQLINPVVHKVTFPLMSHYKESHSIAEIYRRILQLLSLINVPFYLMLTLFPAAVLRIVYGASWAEHGQLMQWLAIYMIFISLGNPVGALLRATGEVRRGFWWNVMVLIIRPLLIAVTIQFGILTVIMALACQQAVLFFLHWRLLIWPSCGLSLMAIMRSIGPAFMAFLIIAGAVLGFGHWVTPLSPLVSMIIIACFYIVFLVPKGRMVLKAIREG